MESLEIFQVFLKFAGLDNKMSDLASPKANYCQVSEM